MDCLRSRDPATRKRVKSVLVAVVVSVLILTVVLVAVLAPKKDPRWKVVPGGPDRIECPGFTTGEECTSHGCSFEVASRGPNCVFPKDGGGGYSLRQVRMPSEDVTLMALTSRSPNTPYGPAIQNVTFQVTHLTENILRIKLLDADHARYEVPVEFPLLEDPPSSTPPPVYEVRTTTESGNPFSFQVVRKEDGTVLWDSSIAGGLSLSDQFVQVAGFLPQHSKVYGLGEHVHTTLQRDMEYRTWPIFARDRFPKEGAEINLYGAHPFYTCLETNSSKSHGVLFLNSNAMEVTLLPAPAISFRSTGGIVDLFFFVGEGPEHVVQLYTQLVGRPMMPPLWGLGFQLARYGYNNLDNVIKVVNRTRNAGIAQAVQYLDIDHMARNRDFSFDQERFKGLIDFMQKTKSEYGLRWIIIVDPAIEAAKGYPLYEDGVRKGVFVKRPRWWSPEVFPEEVRNEEFVYGKVWPEGLVAFPDFFLPATQEWWIEAITNYHKEMPFDGIWIDMNEPSNFGTNEDRPFYCPGEKCWSLKCPPSKLEDPPYNPLRSSGSDRLSTMTLCMESIQGERNYSHYDIHSLYGWSETLPTLRGAQAATGTRSLVISRSTFPSSGRHAGHWLGDNESTWPQMRASIIGMLEFNMFGIPYIGADVCGFGLETTEELCSRWMQLGAFYPYFRNHNGMGLKDQDPASLGPNVARVSVAAVRRRHQLLPYLYTLFHRAHTEGSTVVRPLFHEFPSDPVAQDPLTQEQFMWGRCLLISPILRQGEKTVQVYLPQEADWWLFDFNNTQLEIPGESIVERGDPEDLIPVHVRSGCIIPAQPPYTLPNPPSNSSNSNSTGELELYVFLDSNGEASGEVFLDDGESKDTYEQDQYSLFKFTFKNCTLEVEREGGGGGGGEELPLVRDVFVFVKRRNDEGSGSYYRSVHLLIQGDKRIDEMVGTTSIKLDECQPAPA